MRYNAINFMSHRNINKDLQLRVLKYIEYIHDIENDSPDKGLSVINQISKNLQTQIFNEYYGKIFLQDKSFSLNFSKASIEKLTMKIKERLYGPGEVIFEQEEQDYRLYYLIKGECELYQFNKGGSKQSEYKTISHSSETKFFGYKGFISGIPREMSCRSTNISHVFIITRQDLIEVLKEDPQDYEQFCKIRDQYLLYRNSFGEQCFGCKNFGHTLISCPSIHLIRNKELLIFRNNFSQNQKRLKQFRLRPKYQALINRNNVSQAAQKYRLQVVVDLRKAQFDDNSKVGDIILHQEFTDKRFSKMYPYIKFKVDEMVLCDNYSNEELSQSEDNNTDESSENISFSSQSCETISEEDLDQSKESKESEKLQDIQEENFSEQNIKKQQSDFHIQSSTLDKQEHMKESSEKNIISNMEFDDQISIRQNDTIPSEQHQDIYSQNDTPQLQKPDKMKRSKTYIPLMMNSSPLSHIYNNNNLHSNIQNPPLKVSYTLKNREDQQQKYDEIQNKINKIRFNSKTVLILLLNQNQKVQDTNPFRKEKRNITDSPQLSRQSTKKQTELMKKSAASPSQLLRRIQKKFSRVDFVNDDQSNQQEENVDFLIKDILPFQNTKPIQSFSISNQQRLLKSHTLMKQNTEGQKFSLKKQSDKEIETPVKKDLVLKMYEKQNQQLHQIIQNLVQNEHKKSSSASNTIGDIANFDQNKAKNKMDEMKQNLDQDNLFLQRGYQTFQQTLVDMNLEQQHNLFELFIYDFDTLKEYTKYFPHNNASLVCQSVKAYQDIKKKLGKLLFSKLKQEKVSILFNQSSRIALTPKTK